MDAPEKLQARFTVDTHLFRELGERLVGRDSTALVELIKNAYDADASEVVVYGEGLNNPTTGRIIITDNGIGMTSHQFVRGFLRIASRLKEEGTRRSMLFHRRFTGEKGVGRLAAQKLARFMRIESFPDSNVYVGDSKPIAASIDWDVIESKETLDEVGDTDAVQLHTIKRRTRAKSGTVIELSRLRRSWTQAERTRFYWEVETFTPPLVLIELPASAVGEPLLFKRPRVTDSRSHDPGFTTKLEGDFESGESYFQALAEASNWLIEIDATRGRQVQYAITPSLTTKREYPDAEQFKLSIDHPDPINGPFFQARILAREGRKSFNSKQRAWIGGASGIRVYMEGFRVLPYGEESDDWLEINSDYVKRQRSLQFIDEFDQGVEVGAVDPDADLTFRRKDMYFGAVFLTQDNSPTLRMVVNREGFVFDAAFDNIKRITRIGIDLSVRHSAVLSAPSRARRRETRSTSTRPAIAPNDRYQLKQAAEASIRRANEIAGEAEKKAAEGKIPEAGKLIRKATETLTESAGFHEKLMTERMLMQILAAVGLQMSSFVHEINGLLGAANAVENAVTSLRSRRSLSPSTRKELALVSASVSDLRRIVERQASYLTDITSPDARRRRSRQKLAERFDAGARIVGPAAERRTITIDNEIPSDFRSPSMFPAETALVFSNLLTNAIKAANAGGRIRASGQREQDGTIHIKIENTGKRVQLSEAERWFRPFESTTTQLDPLLGQGMGMGLPITRNILEEYGAEIRFVEPTDGFATALEITFR
jgi:signal transduction histidine kinase